MLKDYLPIFIQVIVAIGFAAIALIFSVLLGKKGTSIGADGHLESARLRFGR